ncbi:MAG: TrbI/VirB10 family protein [Verrucomicrobia bacterium]|nr:TrbI/VirB10 family protein [Verrucomicrobiota bacterium]
MVDRTVLVAGLALLLAGAVVMFALFQRGADRRLVQREKQIGNEVEMLTEPMVSSIRNFNPVLPSKPKVNSGRRVPVFDQSEQLGIPAKVVQPVPPISILAADPQVEKAPPRGPGDTYAPAFRLIKCQLVNTVDSSNVNTPIIGLVTEDLWWNGRQIIRANSEVHGTASVDRLRERIISSGDFTFVLNEADGSGRELVVHGIVLDMEKNDEVNTYGITDGSAGLRGDVIRTANNDLIKLYAASLINGISGAFASGSNGVLGNRVFTNSSSIALSAIQGAAVNPAVGATQSVLDRYADQIASSIERDGFFVRVPAGKQFYVYCTEAIDLSRAKIAADEERIAREDAEFNKRQQREQVRRALPVDASQLLNPLLPAIDMLNKNKN